MLGFHVLSLAAGSYLFTPTAVYNPAYTAQVALPTMQAPTPVAVRAPQPTSWAVPVMLGSAAAGFAFATFNRRGEVNMSATSRRGVLQSAAAVAAAVPFAAVADGASSKAVIEKSRAIYGSRVFRLQKADAAEILEEKNAIKIFISSGYRASANKPTVLKLKGLEKDILKAAKAGDTAGAQAGIQEFVKVGEIRELDVVQGGNFNPKQRRNAGAPATSEIEAQMGPSAYALYKPLKK